MTPLQSRMKSTYSSFANDSIEPQKPLLDSKAYPFNRAQASNSSRLGGSKPQQLPRNAIGGNRTMVMENTDMNL